ncbi:unnamed protein product [Phytophthora lilii]|uniref:Unnamed protein product n=1 Tax=Phytophthora lilii TaxID=2077276 RepID=A0A9W7DCB3_9STRA|nr:unnamed protein product [Phytophthora lilii]
MAAPLGTTVSGRSCTPGTSRRTRRQQALVIVTTGSTLSFWIDNPDVANPTILAITPSAHSGYSKYRPLNADIIDGTSVKVSYESHWPINHALDSTSEGERPKISSCGVNYLRMLAELSTQCCGEMQMCR